MKAPALWQRALPFALIPALLLGLTALMAAYWPIGPDYYYTFRPIAERWLGGEILLYDSTNPGFFNAPWTVFLLVPTLALPLAWGQAALNVASLVSILWTARVVQAGERAPFLFNVLALANLHLFDFLIHGGQMDAFALAGVGLGWAAIRRGKPWWLSVAFWLMTIKPINVVLLGVLFFIAMRRWPLKDWIKALFLPFISLVVSIPVFGADWPLRYLQSLRAAPPPQYLQVTVWHAAAALNIPSWVAWVFSAACVAAFVYVAWAKGLNWLTLSLALATNMVVTPYAWGYHYILLVPAFLFVARHRGLLALLAYGLTWTPLARLVFGFEIGWIDWFYPLSLLAATWLIFQVGLSDRSIVPVSAERPTALTSD